MAKKKKRIKRIAEKPRRETNTRVNDKFSLFYYYPRHYAAYAGVEKLSKTSRVPRLRALEWLEEQDTYNLHRQVRKIFPRRTYDIKYVDDLWEIDLIDFRSRSKKCVKKAQKVAWMLSRRF